MNHSHLSYQKKKKKKNMNASSRNLYRFRAFGKIIPNQSSYVLYASSSRCCGGIRGYATSVIVDSITPAAYRIFMSNGIQDWNHITGSGPQNRILKGDALAYLGKIPESAVVTLNEEIINRGKLDLSNIVKAERKASTESAVISEPISAVQTMSVPVNLSSVFDLSNNIQGLYIQLTC